MTAWVPHGQDLCRLRASRLASTGPGRGGYNWCMNLRPLLVANAPLCWTPALAAAAAAAEPLLAADGGANHLARIGLRPAAVIGDLDSLTATTRTWLGEEALVVRPDQDASDLDKALEYAFSELALSRLTVLGALGGRIDHALANLGLLARYQRGRALVFCDADHELVAVTGEARLPAVPGETWSFWTFDPAVRVTLAGVRWPVERQPLDPTHRLSLSNLATAEQVQIIASGGAAIAQRTRLPGPVSR